MVAWMNAEALDRTLDTGLTHFWSRSRGTLWQKGETSGHRQHVEAVYADCDGDTLLVRVHQDGVACHTGSRTCFFTRLDRTAAAEAPAGAAARARGPRHGGAGDPVAAGDPARGLVRVRPPGGGRCPHRPEGRRGGRRGGGGRAGRGLRATGGRGGRPLVPHARAAGRARPLGAPRVRGARAPAPAGRRAAAARPRRRAAPRRSERSTRAGACGSGGCRWPVCSPASRGAVACVSRTRATSSPGRGIASGPRRAGRGSRARRTWRSGGRTSRPA